MKKINLTKKQIGLIIYFVVGTSIIIGAIWSVYSLFFSGSVNKNDFATNFDDFYTAYSVNYNYNDFPTGLELLVSNCTFSDDNETFTYTLTVKNVSGVDTGLEFQLFFGTEFTDKYASKSTGPFMSYISEESIYLIDEQEYSVEYSSLIIGSTDEEIEDFKDALKYLYCEISLGEELTRVQMPINFISTT